MSRLKGYEAIKELIKVGFKRASFNPDLQLPFTDDARIDSSKSLLIALGYNPVKTNSVDSKEAKNTEEILESTDKKPKSQRMYRGQIIDD